MKKPLSPTYLFTSVNVCKQMTPGIPEVTCELMLFDGPSQYSSKCKCKCNLHETHDYGFIARDVPDMGYQPGVEIMASLLPSLHICKNYHINVKYMYMINEIISQSILDLGLKPSRRYGSFKFISRPIWKR